jgi:hypothetical protein
VIVRILGEGQYEVTDTAIARLDELDAELEAAVDAHDDNAIKAAFRASADIVRSSGLPVPADSLHPADIILPSSDADMAEMLKMLADGHVDS